MPRSPRSTQRDPCRGFEIVGLDAVGLDDAAAQHRHAFERRAGRLLVHEGVEARGVGRRNVEKEERRRLRGQRGGKLAVQIAVDLDHRREQGEAEPEREHDGRRQRAGPVDVGRWRAAAWSSAGAAGAERPT